MIINHFKMRSDIDSYHLGGMGCSAGVIAIGLAQKLLRVGADRAAGFGVVERATHWVGRLEAYLGVGVLPTQVPGLLASTSCCRAFAGLCRYQRSWTQTRPSHRASSSFLQERGRGGYALVVSTENITQNWYRGNERSMLLPNTIFRMGGCVFLAPVSVHWGVGCLGGPHR